MAWCGARPLTPDCHPLVGPTRVHGLYLNAGHSFNGWRDSALSARLLGAQLSGAPPGDEEDEGAALARMAFCPSRFQAWPGGL